MKVRTRNSSTKRSRMVGFRTRSKTHAGRNVIKRKVRRSGRFRVK